MPTYFLRHFFVVAIAEFSFQHYARIRRITLYLGRVIMPFQVRSLFAITRKVALCVSLEHQADVRGVVLLRTSRELRILVAA